MSKRCRDCKRCTESSAKRLVASGPRVITKPLTGTSKMFRKKCRQCGHPLGWHKMVGKRFQD
jgi:hypothetical protein